MADSIKIIVDDIAVRKRLAHMPKLIDQISLTVTYDIARFGQLYIKENMPKDTEVSSNSIGYLVTKNSPGWRQSTILEIYSPHPTKKMKNGSWFDLPWYMFDSPSKALNQNWRSGNINALRGTADMLRAKFEGDMTITIRKEVNK